MKRKTQFLAISILFVSVLSLAACGAQPEALATPDVGPVVQGTPLIVGDEPNLAGTQTQAQIDLDSQAAATAQIVRDDAQATLNSANATLGAVRTQDQNNANAAAAQLAATAQIERAAARATVNSAAATQSAAQTVDAIRQTQGADRATSDAAVVIDQQNRDQLAAGTETAVANQVATQTQAALATTQWYSDQARQADAQRQGPITFLWIVCLPVFLILLAGVLLWACWRWFKMKRDNERSFGRTAEPLPPPPAEIIDHRQDASVLYLERKALDAQDPPAGPNDQMQGWLDEVKGQILSDEKKDEDDQSKQ